MIQLWRRSTASRLTHQAGAWLLDQLPDKERSRVFESHYHMAFLCRFMADMALTQGRGRVWAQDLPYALTMALPKLRSTYYRGDPAKLVPLVPDQNIRAQAEGDALELARVLKGLGPGGVPARRSGAECLADALGRVRTQFQSTLPAFYGLTMCLPLM